MRQPATSGPQIAITLDTYSHGREAVQSDAAAKVGVIFHVTADPDRKSTSC
jgi:hypothetical protein